MYRPYDSPNSWGETYGQHKRHLELSDESYRELKQVADQLQVEFSASAFDFGAVDFLVSLGVPWIKVASLDAGNLGLIEYMASKNKPLIISSGLLTFSTSI